ncbi:hypothetical protein ST201phi2-1p101 [Pseudomonas phage 201phi2-1]|uniref:Uncharacterized protein n=1 Tax=Pseudomonas phage 201phi2-1 TaxID=198110 RepID=B3FIW5_BP201|nr:hypothetical protein ST201phi2-1p101 [Pseudomonas phage 201phi2-1]ABY62934.1 hypothetical protein 201phi2-1p101 [Pseudomonas phage 201phi2-1]
MITRGKRTYLVNLFRPDGFFTYKGKLSLKAGNQILIGMVPVSVTPPPFDNPEVVQIDFDVMKGDLAVMPSIPDDITAFLNEWSSTFSSSLAPRIIL